MTNDLDFARVQDAAGVNRKQMQDFIKQLLFATSPAELIDKINKDYSEMNAASFSIITTISDAAKVGDFARLKPLLDYAFERPQRGGKK
jgi:hypothetical protein